MPIERSRHGDYADPLDVVWLSCARRLRLRIVRNPEVFASWDGAGTLTLCPPDDFDPDDSLAQMVLHELCHALVQGPARRRRVDWGLDNTDADASALQEHACHRLQAALLDLYGLRDLLAVTTDWRPYWDALPADPLAPDGDPAVPLARDAWPEAARGPWSGPLHDALRATADLADAVRDAAPETSLWRRTRPRTAVGWAARGEGRCAGCAWWSEGRCIAAAREVPADTPACVRWEPRLDVHACRACGACCHAGFHLVGVEPDEPLAAKHPELVVDDGHGLSVPRGDDGRCIALSDAAPWTCRVYDLRPQACRDFEIGGEHCLVARRRVGLTRP